MFELILTLVMLQCFAVLIFAAFGWILGGAGGAAYGVASSLMPAVFVIHLPSLLAKEIALICFQGTRDYEMLAHRAQLDIEQDLEVVQKNPRVGRLVNTTRDCKIDWIEDPLTRFLWLESYKRIYNPPMKKLLDEIDRKKITDRKVDWLSR
jgi:hypothetical protein